MCSSDLLGLLGQKLKAKTHVEGENERVEIAHPVVPYNLRVLVEREARRMAGYRQGGDLAEVFLAAMERADGRPFADRLDGLMRTTADPRTREIFQALGDVIAAAIGRLGK